MNNQKPPGATNQTTKTLAKLACDAQFDKAEIVAQLIDHLAFFAGVLRGLVEKEDLNELLTIIMEQSHSIKIVQTKPAGTKPH